MSAYQEIFDKQKIRSQSLKSESVHNRIKRLRSMEKWILAHRPEIKNALNKDLGLSGENADLLEIFVALSEIRHAIKNVKRWTRPRKVDSPLPIITTRGTIIYEPKGVCLIIAPWNFPFHLVLNPLTSAIAAGNTAIIKPSEHSPHTTKIVSKLIKEVFKEDEVAIFEGDAEVSKHLLRHPFDHIFFTGSNEVGKYVMKEAASHSSSVTLELGGKNPAVILPDANLKDAAKKLVWGKFINTGQACVSPDYILVDKNRHDQLIELLKEFVVSMYESGENPLTYGKIINKAHFDRLITIKEDAKAKGAQVIEFGESNSENLFLSPAIFTGVNGYSDLLENEVFGPFIVVITYDKVEEILTIINSKPKPLASYVFTSSDRWFEYINKNTSSGAILKNDCYVHYANHNLPFGGVNGSGFGRSHGFSGFKDFSNEKGVLKQSRIFASHSILYPPYNRFSKAIIRLLVKYF